MSDLGKNTARELASSPERRAPLSGLAYQHGEQKDTHLLSVNSKQSPNDLHLTNMFVLLTQPRAPVALALTLDGVGGSQFSIDRQRPCLL